jgi:hypothetical protein
LTAEGLEVTDTIGEMPEEKNASLFIRMTKKQKSLLVKGAAADERRPTDWVMALVRQRLRKLGILPPRQSKKKETNTNNQ